MKSTNKYVVFNENKDEFLHTVEKGKDLNRLGWCSHPAKAFKYLSLSDAKKTAQRIVNNKGYGLVVCELHESSNKQVGLANPVNILPR